jgi:hypothetical protein
MLNHPTLAMLAELGLHGMAKGFQDLDAQPEARALEHGDWLALLLEREATLRRQKRFETRARTARLRHEAQVEDTDFRAVRGLDRGLFLKLAGCDWIRQRQGLLLTGGGRRQEMARLRPRPKGRPGGLLGRLPLRATALCISRPWRWPIFQIVGVARPGGSLEPKKLNDDQRLELLEIVEDRYERRSTVVTSQIPVDRWYEITGNPTIADAVLDRLVHNAYRIESHGESLRKRQDAPQNPPRLDRCANQKVAGFKSECRQNEIEIGGRHQVGQGQLHRNTHSVIAGPTVFVRAG